MRATAGSLHRPPILGGSASTAIPPSVTHEVQDVSSLMATSFTNVRVLPLAVSSHPSLLGSSRDALGVGASPHPALSRSTVSTAPTPSAAVVPVPAPLPAPVGPTPLPIDRFTLPAIKSGRDYLQTRDLILFWLCSHGFSTGRSDSALITDTTNSLASQYWERQLRMAVQDGPVWHLFDNTGDSYYGCGFEMLASLEANFKPATFSHTFATLLSLVNDKQAEEGIHEFQAHFEGHLHDMSWSAISIPPILQAMLFLWGLHPRYRAIIYLFASKQKDISVASIDSIILDAHFMNELSFFGSNRNPDPITDYLLDTASPLELSAQVESIDDDEYPPAQYDPPVDNVNPTLDSPIGNHMPDGTEGDSVSVGIG
jgi:hypothetical protein